MSGMTDIIAEMRKVSAGWSHGAHPAVTTEQVHEWADQLEADRLRGEAQAEQYPEAAEVCGEAYQVVGSLLDDLGVFDHPHAQKALDNLSQHRMVHTDVLPWPSFAALSTQPAPSAPEVE